MTFQCFSRGRSVELLQIIIGEIAKEPRIGIDPARLHFLYKEP